MCYDEIKHCTENHHFIIRYFGRFMMFQTRGTMVEAGMDIERNLKSRSTTVFTLVNVKALAWHHELEVGTLRYNSVV